MYLSTGLYPSTKSILVVFLLTTCYALFRILRRLSTPLRSLKGPSSPSLIWGLMRNLAQDDSLHLTWAEAYGPTFSYRTLLGSYRLCTFDLKAVAYILSNADKFPKPLMVRQMLGQTVGQGLLVAEGDTHKRQRRIMNPSFSPGQIRDLTPTFFQKSIELRDVWHSILCKSVDLSGNRIDVLSWLNRATLDIIGLTGFGYSFNALSDDSNELARAFAQISAAQNGRFFEILQKRIPPLRLIPNARRRLVKQSMVTMRRIGMELVKGKKQAVQESLHQKTDTGVKKGSIAGRDLLSALIRANMAADLSPAHQLSDEEVLAQISTFLVAGHGTTSSTTTWTLYGLALNPEIQDKLRDELASISEDAPSMDDLNALPYLDMVVREGLRVYSPVAGTMRVATEDEYIPVATPFEDRNGNVRESIHVKAGDGIAIRIACLNRSKDFWGEDAEEFRPERWIDPPATAASIPGVYSHIMSFLGGPRACIGYRFSIIETKALLFTLVRAFSFTVDPTLHIGKKNGAVSRPYVVGQDSGRVQLPLFVTPVTSLA